MVLLNNHQKTGEYQKRGVQLKEPFLSPHNFNLQWHLLQKEAEQIGQGSLWIHKWSSQLYRKHLLTIEQNSFVFHFKLNFKTDQTNLRDLS